MSVHPHRHNTIVILADELIEATINLDHLANKILTEAFAQLRPVDDSELKGVRVAIRDVTLSHNTETKTALLEACTELNRIPVQMLNPLVEDSNRPGNYKRKKGFHTFTLIDDCKYVEGDPYITVNFHLEIRQYLTDLKYHHVRWTKGNKEVLDKVKGNKFLTRIFWIICQMKKKRIRSSRRFTIAGWRERMGVKANQYTQTPMLLERTVYAAQEVLNFEGSPYSFDVKCEQKDPSKATSPYQYISLTLRSDAADEKLDESQKSETESEPQSERGIWYNKLHSWNVYEPLLETIEGQLAQNWYDEGYVNYCISRTEAQMRDSKQRVKVENPGAYAYSLIASGKIMDEYKAFLLEQHDVVRRRENEKLQTEAQERVRQIEEQRRREEGERLEKELSCKAVLAVHHYRITEADWKKKSIRQQLTVIEQWEKDTGGLPVFNAQSMAAIRHFRLTVKQWENLEVSEKMDHIARWKNETAIPQPA